MIAVSAAVLPQPGGCEGSVRSGLVEGGVENAAGFSVPVPNRPLVVPAACSHVTCPHHDRQLLSCSPAKTEPRKSQLISSPLQSRYQRVACSWLIRARRNEASPALFTCLQQPD